MDCRLKQNRNKKECRITKKNLGTLWTKQYKPREKIIKNILKETNPKALKKWNKQKLIKKISVIDNLQKKGMFKEVKEIKMDCRLKRNKNKPECTANLKCGKGKHLRNNTCVKTRSKPFYQWIEGLLVNDEYSSDKELANHIQKEGNTTKKEANFYIKQRDKALLKPLQFKLKKY